MYLSTIENVLLVLLGGFAFCFDLGVFSFREGISVFQKPEFIAS